LLADDRPPNEWHWDYVSLNELREALRASYPQVPEDQVDNMVLNLWARIIAKRLGVDVRPRPSYRRGY
jgi:hypothetical protein